MALARVVSFENVSKDRIEELKREMASAERATGRTPVDRDPPYSTTPTPRSRSWSSSSTPRTTTRTGDATLSAMPTGDTPGRRTSVRQVRRRRPHDRLADLRPPPSQALSGATDTGPAGTQRGPATVTHHGHTNLGTAPQRARSVG